MNLETKKENEHENNNHTARHICFYWQACNFNQKLPNVPTVFMSNF